MSITCSTRKTEEECYPLDESLDYEGNVAMPYCSWAAGDLPDPPKSFEFTRKVFVSFKPDEEMRCDPCDLEQFDALLRQAVEEECNQPYEVVRGCYIPAEETSNGHCWVEGLYFSNCDPDEAH